MPPSLLQLCTATAVRNVKCMSYYPNLRLESHINVSPPLDLNDIGNVPYALARPFLLRVESPEKLRSLEIQSPHIMDDDKELWLEFIKRDIPRWDEYGLPEQADCWYDVYCDLREQVQRAVDEDAEKLKMALDGISSERAKHSAKFVPDRRDIRLPRERPTAKQRYALFDRKMGGIKPAIPARSSVGTSDSPGSSLWSVGRPSMPRLDTKKKPNIFNATKRNSVLAVPTKQLNNRASQVKQAPRSLIEEHRRPPPEPVVTRRSDSPALRAPGRSRTHTAPEPRGQSPMASSSLREREARLRAITSRQQPGSHASTSRALASSRPGNSQTSPPPNNIAGRSNVGNTQARVRVVGSESHQSAESEPNGSSGQGPRPAIIRKRPPPNVFMQPKRKKLN
ncbi:RNA polymerase II transcription factor SIII subunit A-domain-containing protein [Aspergillus avenaceus]|uniref:RNA polymerase II transcription factor SIII subunit A-domain-containing protein n=1 Tax=Aspergillus avenaceus TaxID=36643 RepID=A0A5N6TGP4_ASPAV|nr:RNA polymerase II transcription factor SIII subunit A-domain-containing protein [Aspergillus avenaceus]